MTMIYNRFIKKSIPVTLLLCFSYVNTVCQYYYKDLVSVQQINQNFQLYKANKIKSVKLKSFQGESPVTEGFIGEQTVNLAKNTVVTYTKTADAGESFFTAFYDSHGMLIKTTDSTGESVSTSAYEYDSNSRLSKISHETHAADRSSAITEVHLWEYNPNGKPGKMIVIKNLRDSTIVNFTLDGQGNVTEEQAFRKGLPQSKIFYYYDTMNRLTDVVRYNDRARRLLPDYMFEYDENGELSTFTVVPEGSNDYQKWYYKYDDTGLKVVEFCFNKKNQLLGKVEYNYTEG